MGFEVGRPHSIIEPSPSDAVALSMTRHLESEQQYQISGDKFGRAYQS